jgi:LPS sulfotransferase NodH
VVVSPNEGTLSSVEHLIAVWRGGPKRSFVPFVVLTDSRTGSTWFADLLRSHPSVVSFDEIFHRRAIFGSAQSGMVSRDPVEIGRREADPRRYLKDVVFAPREDAVRAVGFKVFYRHFYRRSHRFGLHRAIAAVPGVRVISLHRRDLLGMLVSRTLAWGPQAGRERITLAPARCVAFFLAYTAQRRVWETYFGSRPLLRVSYEELVTEGREATRRVLGHLECEERPLTSSVSRAERAGVSTVVVNYDQLRRTFRRTPWRGLFP